MYIYKAMYISKAIEKIQQHPEQSFFQRKQRAAMCGTQRDTQTKYHNPRCTINCNWTVCTQDSICHDLLLMVDIGSCLQQSLNCLSMSLPSSSPQRRTEWFLEREVSNLSTASKGDDIITATYNVFCIPFPTNFLPLSIINICAVLVV